MSDIGDFIRKRRTSLRLTLRKVATDAGISPAFLCDIEHGRRYPSAGETTEALARVLMVEPATLSAKDERLPVNLHARLQALERRVAVLESRTLGSVVLR